MLLWIIDPLDNLPTNHDSTLFLAYLYRKMGYRNYFTHELRMTRNKVECEIFEMTVTLDVGVFESIRISEHKVGRPTPISKFETIFFRLEPPVSGRYILQAQLAMFHPNVVNSPVAVQAYSEKFLPLYFGNGIETSTHLKEAPTDGITKPLHSFGGTGVEKVAAKQNLPDNLIFQPFRKEVLKGERRYFTVGNEVFGELLKVPKENDYRTNSVWGAKKIFRPADPKFMKICKPITARINKLGIKHSVIDFIGNEIIEINITCPALWNFWYAFADEKERKRLERALRRLV